jgi:poly(hydroxyalkanoate) depolymerase family esterase
MRRIFTAGIMFSLTMISAFGAKTKLTPISSFGENPGKLSMYIHLPPDFDKTKSYPMVVVMHGCTQNAEHVAEQSGWNKLADEKNFVVMYPEQNLINNPSRCFNWFNAEDNAKGSGEVLSIRNMIMYMVDSFAVDTARIFTYGLSAGAAMSVALMADYPELISAGAVCAGGPFKSAKHALESVTVMKNPHDRTPQEWGALVKQQNPGYKGNYPRLIVVHGSNDKVVSVENSYELVDQWSNLLNTDLIPDRNQSQFEHPDVSRKSYDAGMNKEVIVFYEIKHLGHNLAIDPGKDPKKGGKTGMFAVDKNFHSTYHIARDFGL